MNTSFVLGPFPPQNWGLHRAEVGVWMPSEQTLLSPGLPALPADLVGGGLARARGFQVWIADTAISTGAGSHLAQFPPALRHRKDWKH